jgi:hypothetical protein
VNGTNGVNGTNIQPCVACLLDALVKLDSGAILVNVTANLERGQPGPSGDVSVTIPLVIDVDVALLLQQQLAITLGLDTNATIFEICAAIDAQQEESLDIEAILDALEDELVPIVTAQISQLVNQIAIAISDITGEPIDQALIDEILASIDIDAIVAQITANVQVSLGILEECLDLTPIPPPPPPPDTTETLTVIKNVDCQADLETCEENHIEPSNFTIVIEENNPSQNNFAGSSQGTDVELEAGLYSVSEEGLDPVTPQICLSNNFESGRIVSDDTTSGNIFICTHFSEECKGDMNIGTPQSCTITNALFSTPPTTATLTVKKQVFGCATFPQPSIMECTKLENNSSAPWLDCNGDDPDISDTIFCLSLPESIFDIEVLDDQNIRIVPPFQGSPTGTTIENLEPGTYTVNEIEGPSIFDQLGENPSVETACINVAGFTDGGGVNNSTSDTRYSICFEYEDEQDNDCNTITLAAGEERTCIVKNYIFSAVDRSDS